jgi:hypothetical protein
LPKAGPPQAIRPGFPASRSWRRPGGWDENRARDGREADSVRRPARIPLAARCEVKRMPFMYVFARRPSAAPPPVAPQARRRVAGPFAVPERFATGFAEDLDAIALHGAKWGATLTERWAVERTFAWIGRCRRHSKDYLRDVESSEATTRIATAASCSVDSSPRHEEKRSHKQVLKAMIKSLQLSQASQAVQT